MRYYFHVIPMSSLPFMEQSSQSYVRAAHVNSFRRLPRKLSPYVRENACTIFFLDTSLVLIHLLLSI